MIAPKAQKDLLVELTAGLVAAYVSKNALRASDLPALIDNIHTSLTNLAANKEEPVVPPVRLEPAVHPKKSVTPDHIICLSHGCPQLPGTSIGTCKTNWARPQTEF